jgi:alpha-glucosidase/alpha-D-xyloside xylohydrolase
MRKQIFIIMIKTMETAAALLLLFVGSSSAAEKIRVSGLAAELSVAAITSNTLRITLSPLGVDGRAEPVESDRVLELRDWPKPFFKLTERGLEQSQSLEKLRVRVDTSALRISILSKDGKRVQELVIDEKTGAVSFDLGRGPVFGLGGGGLQFDRRGLYDAMDNGHRSGEYPIFGSRVPIPFLVGTDGWALFFHRPYNAAFDLRGARGFFLPNPGSKDKKEMPLPLDVFIIWAEEPAAVFSEYICLTGKPAMPPKWALGYMQSHRTLAGPEEIEAEAETFRSKKLPCDALIYLGTGYCPAGWNLGHGSLDFNFKTFADPPAIINRLHDLNFKVILHVNEAPATLHGEFPGDGKDPGPDNIANYWNRHRPVFKLGVDGWWPDDGDELPVDNRLTRHLIYFMGPLADRPNVRPFSLHRTGYAGMQRYGGWVWSGDTFSLWDTLAAHVPLGINFSLSASPFWGTDIGGFSSTKELTGELYVRWFQFGAFNPIFRSHGRVWHLRLPWGWNTGEMGPNEVVEGHKGTAAPDPSEFHNAQVEPICQQYLNLRYQLMSYLYSAVRESHDKGLPIMRALWLHYPDDPEATRCGDQYLWGRDILVAPVTAKGVTHRRVYLPIGQWYDFWSNRCLPGKQSVTRYTDLSTMPLYIRAGSIIPFDPVRQYVDQASSEPVTLRIYPGADGEFILYDDDGTSLDYQTGQAEWIRFVWKDAERRLIIEPEQRGVSAKVLPRRFKAFLVTENKLRDIYYKGARVEVQF